MTWCVPHEAYITFNNIVVFYNSLQSESILLLYAEHSIFEIAHTYIALIRKESKFTVVSCTYIRLIKWLFTEPELNFIWYSIMKRMMIGGLAIWPLRNSVTPSVIAPWSWVLALSNALLVKAIQITERYLNFERDENMRLYANTGNRLGQVWIFEESQNSPFAYRNIMLEATQLFHRHLLIILK